MLETGDFKNLGLELNDSQISQLQIYADFLIEFNKHTNITRIKAEDIPILHFYDSLAAANFLDFKRYKSLIDIGSGAGFPGMPLKIAYPHLNVRLVDSKIKKVRFIEELQSRLNIKNCCAVHARAEELAKENKYNGKFDLVTARALTKIENLVLILAPFLKKGGKAILYKGPKLQEELDQAYKQIELSSLRIEEIYSFNLPKEKGERHLMLLDKI